jgi:peroxidase
MPSVLARKRPNSEPVEIVLPSEFRSFSGINNNRLHPSWGSADQTFIRIVPARYADGANTPIGDNLANARYLSNSMSAQQESVVNRDGASDILWQWGQFLDHDITETQTISPDEPFNIPVPKGDPWFDPLSTGEVIIPLNRSFYRHENGVRQQVNAITAYIDASNVYGSDETRALALRRLDGSGKLKTTETSHGDLLPYNLPELDNAPTNSPNLFLAGDVRANEQTGLTAMHTLFVREHNYQACEYKKLNPDADGEEAYQFARIMVAAEIQAITYREFLPVLIGKKAVKKYKGYKPDTNPGIANIFATSAYRFGHSLIPPTLLRLDKNGQEIPSGHLPLADAFFDISHIEQEGIDSILRGLTRQRCQELDPLLVDPLRNFLFGPPGAGGLDLVAVNIQRGRDHGMPSYNEARRAYRLRPARKGKHISRNKNTARIIEEMYDSGEEVDLWMGCICETHTRGAMVGKLLQRILAEQFTRLRDGDRFWYESYLPDALCDIVEQQTLATIIRRNTHVGDEIQDNVFRVPRGWE